MKISVIGGDNRNIELIRLLAKENIPVSAFSICDESISDYLSSSLEEAVDNSDKIILGIPYSRDFETLNSFDKISITYFLSSLNKNQVVYGGVFNNEFLIKAYDRGIKCLDFMKYEEFAILNTIPTVEGAIELAIKNTDITLHDSNVLVVGYGRIGKLLSKILKDMGAKVSVSARKNEDFAWIDTFCYEKVSYDELIEKSGKYDIIFNTVPYMIIDEKVLDSLAKDCLIIDLASKPGGVNFDYADEIGIKYIWALGLPGKVAYKSAAKYMLNIILNK